MTEAQFKIILQKFIEGRASEPEIQLIEKYEQAKLFNNSGKSNLSPESKEKFREDLARTIFTFESRSDSGRTWLKLAASIAVLLGIGSLIFFLGDNQSVEIVNTSEEPKLVALADGSQITLNTNSKVTYDDRFNKGHRNLSLNGEAFFKVAKNTEKPFIISTGNLTTRVVGTEFNVRENDDNVIITVTQGKVKVYHKKDTLNLTQNEQAVYHIKSHSLMETAVNAQLFSYWKNDEVELINTTLLEVLMVLEELFGVPFVFKDKQAKDKLLFINFNKNESIQMIIDRINLMNEVQLKLNSDQMIEVSTVK